MIVQAIALLDDLDKELNIYAMRVKEWYGWHFPELAKALPDNMLYAKTAVLLGDRNNATKVDLTDVLPEELAKDVKEAALISMGTEINEEDLSHIKQLCEEVISISDYRSQLFEYLKSRMNAIAPNLTTLVGELVGARLIAHAGSLMNLAKHPASTVQILGAEKALFRALKSKHNTPKYGLLYHASLIGQAPAKYKGKIARVLAAKCALSSRVDALGEKEDATIGISSRETVETRLRMLENVTTKKFGGQGKGLNNNQQGAALSRSAAHPGKVKSAAASYDASADVTNVAKKDEKKDAKRKRDAKDSSSEDDDSSSEDEKPKKKSKKEDKKAKKEDKKKSKKAKKDSSSDDSSSEDEKPKKKSKKEDKKDKKEKKKSKKESSDSDSD
ncbi:nucleolar protein 58 [Acrasis kona]|uniref:Nucleolar protein 58 n=1 Tax=Acrasis kona TaxID=1008807 RepID=A0AAW2ZM05_9EUKA